MWSSPGSSTRLTAWPVEEYGAVFQDPDDYTVPLLDVFQFLLEQKDKGVVNLDRRPGGAGGGSQDTLDRGPEAAPGGALVQLVFTADLPEEGEETYALLDQDPRHRPGSYYGDDVVAGGQLHQRPGPDRLLPAGQFEDQCPHRPLRHGDPALHLQVRWAPILLVLTIQGSIWINFSFPYLTGTNLFFLAYLIVSCHPDGRHH